MAILLATVPEIRIPAGVPLRQGARPESSRGTLWRKGSSDSGGFLSRLLVVYAIGGVTLGLTGTLVSYYFSLKFSLSPSAIGPAFIVALFASAAASLVLGASSQRRGLVQSWVIAQAFAVVLLALVPLAPAFGLAAGLYILYGVASQATGGPAQALIVDAIGDRRRAQAISWSAAAGQGGSALTPLWAGALIGSGSASLIFFIGAAAALAHVVAYGLLLRRYDWRRSAVEERPEVDVSLSARRHSHGGGMRVRKR